jgi:hypothetical protein
MAPRYIPLRNLGCSVGPSAIAKGLLDGPGFPEHMLPVQAGIVPFDKSSAFQFSGISG